MIVPVDRMDTETHISPKPGSPNEPKARQEAQGNASQPDSRRRRRRDSGGSGGGRPTETRKLKLVVRLEEPLKRKLLAYCGDTGQEPSAVVAEGLALVLAHFHTVHRKPRLGLVQITDNPEETPPATPTAPAMADQPPPTEQFPHLQEAS